MKTDRTVKRFLSLSSLLFLCLGGGLIAFNAINGHGIKTIEVQAANGDIETSTGVTISSGTTVNFSGSISKAETKVLVMEVKSTESVVKFQLRGFSGSGVDCGIVGTDSGVSSVRLQSYNNSLDSTKYTSYWSNNSYSVALTDDWYRWVVDLSDYARPAPSVDLTRIKCLNGTNVQVRNLKFYDQMYIEKNNSAFGYMDTPITNWASQEIQFDIKLPDNNMRRFQICKDSGGGLTGIIRCEKTALTYESISGNPYWETATTAPVSLGDDWYHFVMDLSKVKIAKDRNGLETADRIINLTETNEVIEIRNFGLNVPTYNPADDADLVLKTNARTTIGDVPIWSFSTISFDVYHDSLDLTCDPQFILGQKGTENNITNYFGYKNIGGETALWLRTSGSTGYWVKSTNQPVDQGNGWYKWTINLSELKANNSTGFETVGNIFNRGSKDVYVKNLSCTTYNPANDADMTWVVNNNAMVDDKASAVTVSDWALTDTELSFKAFAFPVVFTSSCTMSFASEKANESADITKDNRISNKFKIDGNGNLVDTSDATKVVGSYSALSGDDRGWYLVKINTDDVIATDPNRMLRYIRLSGVSTMYVKDLAVSQQTKSYDAIVTDHGFVALDEGMTSWSGNTLMFKTFGKLTPVIGLSDGTNLTAEAAGNNLSITFAVKDGSVLYDIANSETVVGTYTALTGEDAGWYKWTLDLEKLPSKSGKEFETATHLWVRTSGAKFVSFIFDDIDNELHQYTVKFGSDDTGSKVNYGSTIVAPTTDPTKPATAQYTYTFDGWYVGETKLASGDKVTKDVTYEAKFNSTVNKYTVKFGTEDTGSELEYGTDIVAPTTNPTKPATAQYTYTFDGWYDGETKLVEGAKVTGNATYEAKFNSTVNKYTVKFGAEDTGSELEYGADIVAPVNPSKQATAKYTYTFDGWYVGETKLEEGTKVTGNVTYEAKFNSTVNKYTVKFGDNEAQELEYGQVITAPVNPIKTDSESPAVYRFEGWYDGEVKFEAGTTVTKDVTYEARFTKLDRKDPSSYNSLVEIVRKGCNSAVSPSLFGILGLVGAFIASKKRKLSK